jgi:membrane associated rhomboid family serine protease
MKFSRSVGAFEFPQTATALLLAVNILVYALVLQRSGSSVPSPEVLFRYGAIYSGALARHEYWRLVACAFLHISMIHILANMACLVWWGGPLERRVGTTYFLLIYLASVIGGSLTSVLTTPGSYLGVGASGGTSGIFGALLCLRLLRRIDLPISFFVTNLGLNITTAFIARVDWRAHFGGFVAGMVACAVIDAFEIAGPRLMRCKFPEFVKLNLAILFAVVVWLMEFSLPAIFGALVALVIVVKVIDVALSFPRGLAWTVVIIATGNALVAGAAVILTVPGTGRMALPPNLVPWAASALKSLIETAASMPVITTLIMFVAVLGLTPLVYWPELMRGLNDRGGFVAAGFRAERGRSRGL